MSLQGGLGIERMCQLAQVSRAGFYRTLQEHQPMDEEMAVRAFNTSHWSIGVGTAIGGSRRSCGDAVSW